MSVAGRTLLRQRLALQYLPQQRTQHVTGVVQRHTLAPRLPCRGRLQSTVADGPLPGAKQRSSFNSIVRSTLGATFFLCLGAFAGWELFPSRPSLIALLQEPPTDEQTNDLYQPPDVATAQINSHILQHPLAHSLRMNPDFTESRPHMKIPEALRKSNLTGGTLAGPGRIAVPPVQFVEKDGKSLVAIMYLGEQLCGHPGIIHGGLLATLLDEGLARCCFPALPSGIGVTAHLKIDYRKPVKAEGYYVLRARTIGVDGRKAQVEGWIEKLQGEDDEPADGQKLVEAEALFIEPRNAGVLKTIYRV